MTPFEKHGQLTVSGQKLTDRNGNEVILRGVSTHGIAWHPEYVSLEAFRTLRDVWGCNCVRAAMYTHEYHGYCTDGDKKALYGLICKAVNAAAELGMYIIVDWHVLGEEDPMIYADEAVRFFAQLSRKYAACGNVLYEICNEPNGDTSWETIHRYADMVIPAIRQHAQKAVVLIGTPDWCQQIDAPLDDPVECSNIMYTLHFYADTHRDHIRRKAERALDGGLPVFVSEFNITDAYGSGPVNYEEGEKWLELINAHGLSAVCWSLSASMQSSSLIKNGCKKRSGWTVEELSATGRWMYDNIFFQKG